MSRRYRKVSSDCYSPDEWEQTPSEKRLKIIDDPERTRILTEEEQNKTTKLMTNTRLDAVQDVVEYEKYTKKHSDIFGCEIDESDKTTLHSSDKTDSDMIAVEPKSSGFIEKIRVTIRTWWLRFWQLF